MEPKKKEFFDHIIQLAWKRQRGKCAFCGTTLVYDNQDKGNVGAWHPHPKILELGYALEDNCLILCINPPNNCHWNIGHGAYDLLHYHYFNDWELPYLYGRPGRHGKPSHKYVDKLKEYKRRYRL
jgi:hypothetical protein